MEKGKDKFKRYAISTAITFVAAFGMTFLLAIQDVVAGEFTAVMFLALISGSIMAGVRAVAKYLYELLAAMPEVPNKKG